MICPKCGTTMQAQAISEIKKRGCITTLFYLLLLFVPIIGWIALFVLLRGKKSQTKSVFICPSCGYRKD